MLEDLHTSVLYLSHLHFVLMYPAPQKIKEKKQNLAIKIKLNVLKHELQQEYFRMYYG